MTAPWANHRLNPPALTTQYPNHRQQLAVDHTLS